MPSTFGVVDLFAGPGGLGEGFASLAEHKHTPFRIAISVEKDVAAHRTLTLRSFLRNYCALHGNLPSPFIDFHAGLIPEPDWAGVDARAWRSALTETRCLELGTAAATKALNSSITRLKRNFDDTILIGGPPCQAYSLVGRARSKGNPGYVPEKDERHYLFREYIRVLGRLRPAAFVMENVKGMLSSTLESRLVFDMLMEDLASLRLRRGHLYELRAIWVENGKARLREPHQPSDFIVRAEEFGVPQRRHRLIVIGIRADLREGASTAGVELTDPIRTVEHAIGGLAPLRSGLSRENDGPVVWRDTIIDAAKYLARILRRQENNELWEVLSDVLRRLEEDAPPARASSALPIDYGASRNALARWLEREELRAVANHETRGHIKSDLRRYLFAAVFGKVRGYSPRASDFPRALRPNHGNWDSGVFNDRFRVQISKAPSKTVTSHISKDGHAFIHYDPVQCRSLTVREAARLQTFPDDYLFLGSRTQQYVQVGNAVPPYLARQIANLLLRAVGEARD